MKKVFPFLNKKDNIEGTKLFKEKLKDENQPNKNDTKSSGSATGTLRNKCCLKPGHSLMDWIRLGSSGVDLNGRSGMIYPVSHSELSKHCTQNDAWIAIRNKVYNVSYYMDYHPGGIDELMKGVGKDGTRLFDEVHSWVNFEQLLSKCYVGPLSNSALIDITTLKPKALTPTSSSVAKIVLKKSNSNPDSEFVMEQIEVDKNYSKNTEDSQLPQLIKNTPNNEKMFIPRFDWIQNAKNLIFIFYTKAFSNAGVIALLKSSTMVNIRIYLASIHDFGFNFHGKVKWPCVIKSYSETGKIEVILNKEDLDIWPSFGDMTNCNGEQDISNNTEYEYYIEKNIKINHDSFAILLKSENSVILFPVGYHTNLTVNLQDKVTRSYTPVPLPFTSFDKNGETSKVILLIKSYTNGNITKILSNENNIDLKITLSRPKGNFSLLKLLDHNRIALFAAGSGITPMLGLIDHLLSRKTNILQYLELYYFNKTEDDIWCREYLSLISCNDNRFKVNYILSRSDSRWTGNKGTISEYVHEGLTNSTSSLFATFVCICGPYQFNERAVQLLTSLNFSDDHIHLFQS